MKYQQILLFKPFLSAYIALEVMEYEFNSCIRGYHVYKDAWQAEIGELLSCHHGQKSCHHGQSRGCATIGACSIIGMNTVF